jgi:hypothetical protein
MARRRSGKKQEIFFILLKRVGKLCYMLPDSLNSMAIDHRYNELPLLSI